MASRSNKSREFYYAHIVRTKTYSKKQEQKQQSPISHLRTWGWPWKLSFSIQPSVWAQIFLQHKLAFTKYLYSSSFMQILLLLFHFLCWLKAFQHKSSPSHVLIEFKSWRLRLLIFAIIRKIFSNIKLYIYP